MKNKIIFIINPIAGKGKGKIVESQIQQFFHSKNYNFKTFLTEKKGHATELTKQAVLTNPDIIVACGGDGTINEIAQQLIGTDINLGIIPIGSGNGLAAHLNVPKSVTKALEVILTNHNTTIDVGKINNYYFFSNIGLGIDAAVIKQYTKTEKRSFIGYATASIKTIWSYKSKKFEIELSDGENLNDTFYFLFCSNSNEAGYGISFSPKAKLSDGKLDLLIVKKLNFIRQIQFSIYVILKCLEKMHQAKMLQVTQIKFHTNQTETLVQIDGESFIFEKKTIEVSVIPNSLNVVIPY